jgi:hypothetical protein
VRADVVLRNANGTAAWVPCGQLQGVVVLLLLHLWRMQSLRCWVMPRHSCKWLGVVMTTVHAGCKIMTLCGCCTAVAQPEVAPALAPAANALPAAGPVAWACSWACRMACCT